MTQCETIVIEIHHTLHQDFPLMGTKRLIKRPIKRLIKIPLMQIKLCQKSMTLKNFLRVFLYKFKLIDKYQWKDPRPMSKNEGVLSLRYRSED